MDQYYKRILEELLKLMDEGVYIVDENGVGIFYNEAMAKNEKINVEDVIGKEFHLAFPGVEPEDSTMYQALKKGVATRNKQQSYINLYGKEVTTMNNTVPVTMDGKTIAAVEVADDITDIRSMSDTIMELRSGSLEPGTKKTAGRINRYTFSDIIGANPDFLDAVARARKAAGSKASVFIYGETGTGKELFAQSIHYAGDRGGRPFLAQNCAALPESLLEGILFGTAKGGFTGAVDRAGLFEQASGGTLLLDEVSAMPYELQSKLLRVLQENYIRRVGGTQDIPVDVRIIATVNERPEKLIEEGKLRKDLYYRLNVVNISIPALRERKDDIPLLVEKFLEKHSEMNDKQVWMASDKALSTLEQYNYPGNVRELENIIAQSISMAEEGHVLNNRLLQMPENKQDITETLEKWTGNTSLDEYMSKIERGLVKQAMIQQGGNISKAAEALGIKRQTLQHKLKKFGIRA